MLNRASPFALSRQVSNCVQNHATASPGCAKSALNTENIIRSSRRRKPGDPASSGFDTSRRPEVPSVSSTEVTTSNIASRDDQTTFGAQFSPSARAASTCFVVKIRYIDPSVAFISREQHTYSSLASNTPICPPLALWTFSWRNSHWPMESVQSYGSNSFARGGRDQPTLAVPATALRILSASPAHICSQADAGISTAPNAPCRMPTRKPDSPPSSAPLTGSVTMPIMPRKVAPRILSDGLDPLSLPQVSRMVFRAADEALVVALDTAKSTFCKSPLVPCTHPSTKSVGDSVLQLCKSPAAENEKNSQKPSPTCWMVAIGSPRTLAAPTNLKISRIRALL
mmetsp:Transcript_7756/g.21118  ORF Transcript_7756/g.21118 Transcript_7756/m.21118 type:complete len:340 (-) Transcript_7756:136-1155(-)